MAINYASKYIEDTYNKFLKESVTTPATNNNYDFVGVKSVKLDFMQNEIPMSMEKSFAFTIERGTYNDTQMSNATGTAFQRQLREVVIPEIDKYRLEILCRHAGIVQEGVIAESGAYDVLNSALVDLSKANVSCTNMIVFATGKFYKEIKLEPHFIQSGNMAVENVLKGQVGMIDGASIILVPTSYLPNNTEFIIVNQAIMPSPIKLSEYKIHDNPPGLNGWLVEGRVYYDAYIPEADWDSIYIYRYKEQEEHQTKRRFKEFSDNEVYMLHRSCMEGSAEIVMGDKYNSYEKQIHGDLLNELIEERKERGI